MKKNDEIKENLVSIEEYLRNNISINTEYLKEQIDSIKASVETYKDFFESNSDLKECISKLADSSNKKHDNSKVDKQLKLIEETLSLNSKKYNQIVEKLEYLSSNLNDNDNADLKYSISELSDLKDQIKNLTDNLNNNNTEIHVQNLDNDGFINFITSKLEDIRRNISKITDNTSEALQEGFAYNTQLIEEKTGALLNLVNELNFTGDKRGNLPELLSDFKQELELINTDITENLARKTDKLLEELNPIKDFFKNLSTGKDLKKEIDELYKAIVEDSQHAEELDDLYRKINDNLNETENRIKDFIIGDTDSLIIKVDNLKEYVERSLGSFTPPEPEKMAELFEFVENINQFKQDQKDLIQKATDLIQENMAFQHDEIKSMLSVSFNHEAIVEALENLKKTFKEKMNSIAKIQSDGVSTAFSNELNELKNSFASFAGVIKKLSDKNKDLDNILGNINEKINEIFEKQVNDEVTLEEFSNIQDFDFQKAFEFIQKDIESLHSKVEEAQNSNSSAEALKEVLKSVDWFSKSKNFVAENLKLINQKLDILALNDNQDTLDEINEKLDILAFNNNQESFDKINEKLDNIAEIDHKEKFDELNSKLDFITSNDNKEDFDKINEKLDNIAEIDHKEKFDELNSKLDFITSNDNKEDFDKINEKLDNIAEIDHKEKFDELNSKLDFITSNDNKENFDKINEKLDNHKETFDELNSKLDFTQSPIPNPQSPNLIN